MRNVIRITTEGTIRPVWRRALDRVPAVADQASLIALIQAVIPWGLQAVGDVLEAEVTNLAGARYSRTGGQPRLVRWGQQAGSVYLSAYLSMKDLVHSIAIAWQWRSLSWNNYTRLVAKSVSSATSRR